MSLFFVFLSIQGQNCLDVKGHWINELGSVLVVDSIDVQTGAILGSYKSSAGVDGRVFPLQGWVNEKKESEEMHCVKVISFSVRWGEYGSITSWTGYCDKDDSGCFIKTIWNLVRPNTAQSFEHIMTNSSTFRPL